MWPRHELSAVILAGGAGQRLGQPKATLKFTQNETLLACKVHQLRPHFERIIIVANDSIHDTQSFENTETMTDHDEYQGPLIALAPVFQVYASQTKILFITGCDFPFFQPHAIQLLIDSLGDNDIALFDHDSHLVPLSAIYRTQLATSLDTLIKTGERRLMRFIDHCTKTIISSDALRPFDPSLSSLLNVNTPEDLESARKLL